MTSTPQDRPVPRPAPPGAVVGVPGPAGSDASPSATPLPDLPDDEQLAAMTIREHVTLFEDLHRTLADRLNDTGA